MALLLIPHKQGVLLSFVKHIKYFRLALKQHSLIHKVGNLISGKQTDDNLVYRMFFTPYLLGTMPFDDNTRYNEKL